MILVGFLSFLFISRLRALDLEVGCGAQVRAQSRWVEEGESSSAYFFRVEKKNGTDRNISALRASDSTLVADKDGLCDVFASIYSDLFSAAPCDSHARAELLSNITSVLPFDESEVCEGLLSQEECFAALQGMACGKAPGCDGVPMEFYLKFWHVLGFDLVCVLNSAFGLGSLSHSQRQGIIAAVGSFIVGNYREILVPWTHRSHQETANEKSCYMMHSSQSAAVL